MQQANIDPNASTIALEIEGWILQKNLRKMLECLEHWMELVLTATSSSGSTPQIQIAPVTPKGSAALAPSSSSAPVSGRTTSSEYPSLSQVMTSASSTQQHHFHFASTSPAHLQHQMPQRQSLSQQQQQQQQQQHSESAAAFESGSLVLHLPEDLVDRVLSFIRQRATEEESIPLPDDAVSTHAIPKSMFDFITERDADRLAHGRPSLQQLARQVNLAPRLIEVLVHPGQE
jgi:hypothetical protein